MNVAELRGKSVEELNDELVSLRREQFNLRMQQATGEMPQVHQHGRVKKDIARVKTIINEITRVAGEKK